MVEATTCETVTVHGMSEGELYYALAEARASARVLWAALKDSKRHALDEVAKYADGIDGNDIVTLALLASCKVDKVYDALFDPPSRKTNSSTVDDKEGSE